MIASRQRESPYYRAVGRQRGRDLGLLQKLLGVQQFPFCVNMLPPSAKHIGSDMLEFAAPEIGEPFSNRKSFKTATKSVGKQTLEKRVGWR